MAGDAYLEGQCSRRFSLMRLCSMSLLADGLTAGEEVREVRLKGETDRRRDLPRSVLDSSGRRFLELGMLRSRVRPREASRSVGGTTVILISRNESPGGAIVRLMAICEEQGVVVQPKDEKLGRWNVF